MKPITGFRLGISNLHRQRDKVRVQLDSKTSNLDVDLTMFLLRIFHITSAWSYVQWSFAAESTTGLARFEKRKIGSSSSVVQPTVADGRSLQTIRLPYI